MWTSSSSSQRNGAETKPVGRTPYADETVLSRAFWLKSTKIPRRSSFHHFVVTRSGMRRSNSRAKASTARLVWMKSQIGSIRM